MSIVYKRKDKTMTDTKACLYYHDNEGHWAQHTTTDERVKVLAAEVAVEIVTPGSKSRRWPAFGDLGEDYLYVFDDLILYQTLFCIGETDDELRGYDGYHEGEAGYRSPHTT
jgi:hypothetical protein